MRGSIARGDKLAIHFVPVNMQVHMLQHMSMHHKRHKVEMGLRRALRCFVCVVCWLRRCASCLRRKSGIALHSTMLLQELFMLHFGASSIIALLSRGARARESVVGRCVSRAGLCASAARRGRLGSIPGA